MSAQIISPPRFFYGWVVLIACFLTTMMASGTISGSEDHSFGSMLELAWKGTKPLIMADGTERRFINDGDTVIMRGHGVRDGVRIGFGEVRSRVDPAA